MNCKKNAKSRSDDEHRLFDPAVEKVVEIGLERLRPFENHPFKVKEDEAMARLMESIERYAYYKRVSIDRKQFVQRNIKREFSKFEKYKDAIPHGGCVL